MFPGFLDMSKGGGIEPKVIFFRLFEAEGRGAISRIEVREPGYSSPVR